MRKMQYTEPGPQRQVPTDEGEFIVYRDVPVFDLHEADDGTVYSTAVLQGMVDTMNERIADTGDYAPLTAGHRPDPEDRAKGEPEPDVLGYAGPFYVATFGKKTPRPCIFARAWKILKTKIEEARKRPRRSVEVWPMDDPKKRFFDPIALLGAETPRRDLGLLYARPKLAERYEMGAASTVAGGSNTFVPGECKTTKKPTQYEEGANMADCTLTDADLAAIVNELKPVCAALVAEAMPVPDELETSEPEAPEAVKPKPNEMPTDGAPLDTEGAAPEQYEETGAQPGDDEPTPTSEDDDMSEADKKQAQQYARERDTARGEVTKYKRERDELATKYAKLEGEVKAHKAAAIKAECYAKVREHEAQGVVLDVEAEVADLLTMDEAGREKHFDRIATKYSRAPVGRNMPLPELDKAPIPDGEEAKSRDLSQRARKYALAHPGTDYKTALEKVTTDATAA